MKTQREILGRLGAALRRKSGGLALAALALASSTQGATAQSTLGMPFIGRHHLSFYSTELSKDGVGKTTSTLLGGRYGYRFGDEGDAGRLSLAAQVAARSLADGNQGIGDLSLTVAWTRRVVELTPDLSLTAAAGMAALAWGFDDDDTGIAHASMPFTAGIAYDLHIGRATLTPFVAPGIAYYDNRTYQNDVRQSKATGWDAHYTAGASLTLNEVVLTTSGIHGEHGLLQTGAGGPFPPGSPSDRDIPHTGTRRL